MSESSYIPAKQHTRCKGFVIVSRLKKSTGASSMKKSLAPMKWLFLVYMYIQMSLQCMSIRKHMTSEPAAPVV